MARDLVGEAKAIAEAIDYHDGPDIREHVKELCDVVATLGAMIEVLVDGVKFCMAELDT